jgi:hypothetical protein
MDRAGPASLADGGGRRAGRRGETSALDVASGAQRWQAGVHDRPGRAGDAALSWTGASCARRGGRWDRAVEFRAARIAYPQLLRSSDHSIYLFGARRSALSTPGDARTGVGRASKARRRWRASPRATHHALLHDASAPRAPIRSTPSTRRRRRTPSWSRPLDRARGGPVVMGPLVATAANPARRASRRLAWHGHRGVRSAGLVRSRCSRCPQATCSTRGAGAELRSRRQPARALSLRAGGSGCPWRQ